MSKHHEPKPEANVKEVATPVKPTAPTVTRGRIVDYTEVPDAVSRTGVAAPAMVIGVNPDGTVTLRVFAMSGEDYRIPNVPQGHAKAGTPGAYGTWSWPERV